jgi:hypothetical protein
MDGRLQGFSRHILADRLVWPVQDGFQGGMLSGTMMSAQPTVIGSHDSLPSSFSYIKDLGMSQVGTFENLGISGMAQVGFFSDCALSRHSLGMKGGHIHIFVEEKLGG